MAFVVADRVKVTVSAPGAASPITLGAAVTGFQDFSVIGDGNTTYYTIADQFGANWEVGIGTYTAAGTLLSRDTVLANSAGTTSLINFSSGTQDVFVTYPAGKAIFQNNLDSVVVAANTSSDALRITQTGSGNALLVEDSANPDASPFAVDASGRLLAGATTSYAGLFSNAGNVQISSTSLHGIQTGRFANDAFGSDIQLLKSRSATIGAQTIVQNGDSIGSLLFGGSDGTAFILSAAISANVDGTPGTNDMPGRLAFLTTADGASSPTERMRIGSLGSVGIGVVNASNRIVRIGGNTLAASGFSYSLETNPSIQSDVSTYRGIASEPSVVSTAFTLGSLSHFYANQGTIGAGSTVTNQFGFHATSSLTGATNNYGFYSDIASGTGRWNFYANGTAQNYFAGTTLIGTTTNTNSSTLVVNGTISQTVSSTQYLVVDQSDIGTGANEIPLNQYLGANAYVDTETPALNIGTGITTGTGTICRANGGLSGGIYRMTILIDLTGLNSGGTAGDIIGVNGTALPCYIAQLPAMTVLGGRMTCLETPAGGDTDIDLYSATEGTGVEDQAITALTETQIINAGAQTIGTVTYFAADPATNAYFYLVGQGTANATYTAGRFLIEIFGVQ